MKIINYVILFILYSLIIQCASKPKVETFVASANGNKYFNHDDIEISAKEFVKIRNTYEYLVIPLEDDKHFKLIERFEKDTLENPLRVYEYFEKLIGKELNKNQAVFIDYHPGLDECNTSGNITLDRNKDWNYKLNKVVKKYTQNQILHIAKNNSKILEGQSETGYLYDKDELIEDYFFKHHYPCSSFVIILPDGRYYSWFGEYGYTLPENIFKELHVKKV